MSTSPVRPKPTLLGVPLAQIPTAVIVGIVFVFLTLPEFFREIEKLDVNWSIAGAVLDKLDFGLHKLTALSGAKVEPFFENPDVKLVRRYGTMIALLAAPVLAAAAVIGSARVRSWRPFVMTVGALILGIVALPALCLMIEIGIGLARLVLWFYRFVVWVIAWASPFLAVLALLFAAGLLVWMIVLIHRAHRWLAASIVVAVVAGAVMAIRLGLLDGFFRLVGRLAGWIARYVGPVVGWIVSAILVIAVVLALIGAMVGLFGHIGRTVVLPFGAAGHAGSDQEKCIDTAAGLGVALSMPLTAAVTDSEYRKEFLLIWPDTPLFSHLPPPVDAYDFLFRDVAEKLLAYGFRGFNPTVDLILAVAVSAIAVGSLLFGGKRWSTGKHASVLSPVMLGVGLAIAFAIPALLLTMWSKAQPDD